MSDGGRVPIVVLISGNGSNLQALLDGAADGTVPVSVRAVISNRADAYGLERARRAGVPALVHAPRDFPDRQRYDAALAALIDRQAPDLVVLAGFMRILGSAVIDAFAGRMLNVHPSLLPAYPGLHTHRRVLEAGDGEHGCSVHFVTDMLDGGPVVIQARVRVRPGDDEERLSARVQAREHRILPLAVGWFASGRLRMKHGAAWLDGERLAHPVIYEET